MHDRVIKAKRRGDSFLRLKCNNLRLMHIFDILVMIMTTEM